MMEAASTTVSFNGQKLEVVYPVAPLNGWGLQLGWGNSPAFYPNMIPVVGRYKRACGRMAFLQLLIDSKTGQLVTEFNHTKKGTCLLQEIVPTQLKPGNTLFK